MDPSNSSTTTGTRAAPFLVLLIAMLLALGGYLTARYTAQEKLQDPAVRLNVALQALQSGSDETARQLLASLATAGNATAQYWLADLYQHGLGGERDPQKAVDLLTKSANQHFVLAEERLGEVYLHGRLVLQDLTLAREWLGKAAADGDDVAQYELSQIYDRGWGVQSDPIQAYAWAAVAAAHGNALAQRERDRILTGLSPDQVKEAEARAKDIMGTKMPSARNGPN
jgi:TPR repeat protein